MKSSEHYYKEIDKAYASMGTGISERQEELDRELRELGFGSRKEGIGYQSPEQERLLGEAFEREPHKETWIDKIRKKHKGWTADQVIEFYEKEKAKGKYEDLNLEALRRSMLD